MCCNKVYWVNQLITYDRTCAKQLSMDVDHTMVIVLVWHKCVRMLGPPRVCDRTLWIVVFANLVSVIRLVGDTQTARLLCKGQWPFDWQNSRAC